ncbi:MAG: 50S ribosomal protein L31e [archaeon]|nr:50S ribosomal protein L31e [archaeon]MCP8305830.1 50S ribosomal protein L31e [archaeon]
MISLAENEVLERIYTIPLGRALITPRYRRAKRSINIIKEFAARHMKSSDIKISPEVNEKIWERGIKNPPRRITVKMVKDEEGTVKISLPTEE